MASTAYIVDAVRTPIGRYGGTLAGVRPDDLAALPARLERIRGQTTVIDLDALSPARRASLHLPRLPVSGQGYAIHIPAETARGTDTRTGTRIGAGARLLVGATSQPGDTDPQLRLADQHENLKRAAALGIFGPGHHHAPPDWALTELPLAGRVGWRLTAPDRLGETALVLGQQVGNAAAGSDLEAPRSNRATPG